jgi:hypothetical protein
MERQELQRLAESEGLFAAASFCWATSDGNLFSAGNEHYAKSHAVTCKLEMYRLEASGRTENYNSTLLPAGDSSSTIAETRGRKRKSSTYQDNLK